MATVPDRRVLVIVGVFIAILLLMAAAFIATALTTDDSVPTAPGPARSTQATANPA